MGFFLKSVRNRPRNFIYDIREKSFNLPDYFVFVARHLDKKNDFVIIPKSLIHRFADMGVIGRPRSGDYRATLRFGIDGRVWIQKRENDVIPYLNNWTI